MRIKQIIKRLYIVVFNLYTALLQGRHLVEGYKLSYPWDFTLPYFQKNLPLYDRFLPILARQISSDSSIVDVGANVGDTTLAFLGNSTSNVVSIEASDKFIHYLKSTVGTLPQKEKARVQIVKTFVGSGDLAGDLDHSGGTATLNVSSNVQSTHTPLDNLVDANGVGLIKVDVDGFDFDVLLSAQEILKVSSPILFWENVVLNSDQFAGYRRLYDLLETLGYGSLWVFDNKGCLLVELGTYSDLLRYSQSLLEKENPNLGYIDVLACVERDKEKCLSAIKVFKQAYSI